MFAQWLYVGCWWSSGSSSTAVHGAGDAEGVCTEPWCPPPAFPDLLVAFAGSLARSPAMLNLTVSALLSPPAGSSPPCRRLLDCCLPRAVDDAASPPPSCSVDRRLPPLPSCRVLSRDQNASGRDRPAVQFSRSLEVMSDHILARYCDTVLRMTAVAYREGQNLNCRYQRSSASSSSSAAGCSCMSSGSVVTVLR